ncbi:cytochrome b5 reductase 4 isoform X4 [Mixophyes fleayi]|uniref:cytochrome b5 reductase 4 isoform X4 n=1 Tax=Mixophyes fleayi TaxID=3061075 RepID=UPI003F4D8176
MLNVPAPSFPVPSSQQRVSAGGRNKTPLKPGRSLMDWIKVKSSGKDLTGLKGRLIEVTEEELAKHNKKTDCWICIRGLVYNVTPYMEYHPGGEEELMKAAGADGTQLFDQVHRWVNYESMLKECLIGRMAVKHASSLKGGKSTENAGKEILNGAFSNSKHPQEADKPIHPRYDWFQTDSTVTMVIYTKQKDMSSDRVTVDYQENILRGEITVGDYSYLLLIELSHPIQNFEVNASGRTGNVELILQKKDHNVWKSLGQSLEGHDTFIKNSQRGDYVFVSSPRGCFRTAQVEKMEDIFLVAAGTGFTPMVKLLRHVLNRASNLRKVKLIFFNKTENDILWREQLENLCLTDKRFEAQFILSEPSDLWTGYKGQISHSLLSEAVARSKKDSKVLTCICGPNGFIDQGTRFLEGLGFSQEEIFVFRE